MAVIRWPDWGILRRSILDAENHQYDDDDVVDDDDDEDGDCDDDDKFQPSDGWIGGFFFAAFLTLKIFDMTVRSRLRLMMVFVTKESSLMEEMGNRMQLSILMIYDNTCLGQ